MAGELLVGGLLGAGLPCAEVGLEPWGGGTVPDAAGEPLVGGLLLGAGDPRAEVGLELRRLVPPVWAVGGRGRFLNGFSPGGPGGGNGNGLGIRRAGSTRNGGIGPADGSISVVGDWLGSLVRPAPLVGGPVVGQRYQYLACEVKF